MEVSGKISRLFIADLMFGSVPVFSSIIHACLMSQLYNLCTDIPRIYNLIFLILFFGAFIS